MAPEKINTPLICFLQSLTISLTRENSSPTPRLRLRSCRRAAAPVWRSRWAGAPPPPAPRAERPDVRCSGTTCPLPSLLLAPLPGAAGEALRRSELAGAPPRTAPRAGGTTSAPMCGPAAPPGLCRHRAPPERQYSPRAARSARPHGHTPVPAAASRPPLPLCGLLHAVRAATPRSIRSLVCSRGGAMERRTGACAPQRLAASSPRGGFGAAARGRPPGAGPLLAPGASTPATGVTGAAAWASPRDGLGASSHLGPARRAAWATAPRCAAQQASAHRCWARPRHSAAPEVAGGWLFCLLHGKPLLTGRELQCCVDKASKGRE